MITDCLLTYNFIYKTKQLDGAAETVGLARGEDEGDLLGAFDLGDIVGDDEGDSVGDSVPVLILMCLLIFNTDIRLALVLIELTVTSISPSLRERVYVPPADNFASSVDLA